MASDLDFERKHPRHPSGSSRGGQFAGVAVTRGDWADELASRMRRKQYKSVDYRDLQLRGEPVGEGPPPWTFGNTRRNLTEQERAGVYNWTRDVTRGDIATFLRSGEVDDPIPDDAGPMTRQDLEDLHMMVDMLDSAIAAGTLARDAELWRAVVVPKYQDREDLFPLGAQVTDRSFLATSFSLEGAQSVAMFRVEDAGTGYRPIYLKILAPAGTHASPGAESVDEMVLPRDLRTRVVDYDLTEDGDEVVVLEVES